MLHAAQDPARVPVNAIPQRHNHAHVHMHTSTQQTRTSVGTSCHSLPATSQAYTCNSPLSSNEKGSIPPVVLGVSPVVPVLDAFVVGTGIGIKPPVVVSTEYFLR